MKTAKNEPDIEILFEEKMSEIFATLNCMQVGKINSFDKSTQSATVEIQMRACKNEDEIINYPLLVDVPVIYNQGGGAFLEFPIKKGDLCLVFFCDRDTEDWWVTGNVAEPKSLRKHNLSDGFALVGVNSKASVLSLDNDKVRINAGTYPIVFETTAGKLEIAVSGNITFNDGTQAVILGTDFMTQLNIYLQIQATMTPGSTAQNAACLSAIKAGAIALQAQLNSLLSTKIKVI